MRLIQRAEHLARISIALDRYPVVALVGPRQVGKTTLARVIAAAASSQTQLFDLENPSHLAQLADPMLALESRRGLVILDEIQRVPEIFPALRVLADRPGRPATFLVLGSASPDLLRQSSESLAGRIHYHEVDGLRLHETGPGAWPQLWLRGGFPRAFTAGSDEESAEWRRDFIRTFLERDLPQLGFYTDATTLRRFWTMVAHYHGGIWNASEVARSLGVATTSVRRYLDVLTSALVVDQLPPWFENIGKRQVKSPKVFIRDSGLLHSLLGIERQDDLLGHPKVGASWEGFAMQQLAGALRLRRDECYFWATHAGAELDLLVIRGSHRWGFEIKRTSQPAVTRSMRAAMEDLSLRRLFLIHPGSSGSGPGSGIFPLSQTIAAVGLEEIGALELD